MGSGGVESGNAIAVDRAGNVYVTGSTEGGLPGAPEANADPGTSDVFVAKYSDTGSRIWVHEFGSTSYDYGTGIAVDRSGNAYIAGYSLGQLPGAPDAFVGFYDAFVAKLSTGGATLWVHEVGVANHTAVASGIAVDTAGDALITGWTDGRLPGQPESNAGGYDAFIARYSTAGARVWVHRLGSPDPDFAHGIALDDAGNAYIVGSTGGRIPGQPEANSRAGTDVFVAKYATTGKRLWTRQLGARGDDAGNAIAIDSAGDAFITGSTAGRLPGSPEANAGQIDVFVAKYSEKGSRLWVQQLGSKFGDGGDGVAVDSSSDAYVTGLVGAHVPGGPPTIAGALNAFVAGYSATGSRVFVHQLLGVYPAGIALDRLGNTYVTGASGGGPVAGAPEAPAGGSDIFIARNL